MWIQTSSKPQGLSKHTFLSHSLDIWGALLQLALLLVVGRLTKFFFWVQTKGAAADWAASYGLGRNRELEEIHDALGNAVWHAPHYSTGCSLSHGQAQHQECIILLESNALYSVFLNSVASGSTHVRIERASSLCKYLHGTSSCGYAALAYLTTPLLTEVWAVSSLL